MIPFLNRYMRNVNKQGMNYKQMVEDITEDLRKALLHIGDLIKELEEKIKETDLTSATKISVKDRLTKAIQLASRVVALAQYIPRTEHAEGVILKKNIPAQKNSYHTKTTKAKLANSALHFKKGNHVYILSKIKKKGPGPVTIEDCRGTVTGINRDWIYIVTNASNDTHCLAHNICHL